MHELSIAQALVEQIRQTVREQRATRVLRVGLQVGALSGVEPHALRMAFPIAAETAGLGEVDLDIDLLPSRVECRECGHTFSPPDVLFMCENCESAEVDIISGRELQICSLQIQKN